MNYFSASVFLVSWKYYTINYFRLVLFPELISSSSPLLNDYTSVETVVKLC